MGGRGGVMGGWNALPVLLGKPAEVIARLAPELAGLRAPRAVRGLSRTLPDEI